MNRTLAWSWALIVCLLLGHNAWLWLGKRIAPETDILALLPVQEQDPVLRKSFTQMVDAAQQRVVVLVGAADWSAALRAADAYSAVLAQRPDLIEANTPDESTQQNWLAAFTPHRLALLTAQQEAQLHEQPPQFWTDLARAKLYGTFTGPKLGAFRDDPFGLFDAWVQQRSQETPVRPRDGHLFVADDERQYVLLPLTLKRSAYSVGVQTDALQLLERAATAARTATHDVRIISTGVVLHAAAASSQANREIHTIGAGSLLGIILLTWLVFRSVRPIALVLLSIGIGFLGALSVCWLLFGSLHLLTLVFGASLIGVAQDYGIFFLCQRLDADCSETSRSLMQKLLPALALSLLAAIIGYLGLGMTPFPGLRHMAVFSAIGLLCAWLTVVCWFPQLIGAHTLRRGQLSIWYCAALQRWPRVRFTPAWFAMLILLALMVGFGWSRLGVNDDIRSLQTPPKALLEDQIAMGKLLDAPTPVQYFLVRGASAEEVLQREEELKHRLDRLVVQHNISGYHALSNWVPAQKTQAGRRELIDAKLLGENGPLSQLAGLIGEDAAWVAATREHLLTPHGPLSIDEFLKSPPGEPWRHLWLGEIDGVYASVVALRGLALANAPEVRKSASGLEGVQWVDKVGEISSLLGRYREYMSAVVTGAYVLVFALLYPRYRKAAWRVLAPTALATALTIALLGLAGIPLQLFHVLALMLLLGVGVDYGIFMQERLATHHGTAWLAVGLSALNTLLGFGLLGLSNTPALHAFGITMFLGVTLVWLAVPCFAKPEEDRYASQA